jgi:hypothetical protein
MGRYNLRRLLPLSMSYRRPLGSSLRLFWPETHDPDWSVVYYVSESGLGHEHEFADGDFE